MPTDRIALVTGGAGGLGYTICTKLDEKGYRVVLTHSPGNTTIKETLADMKAKGHDFTAYPVDVADYDSCQRCVAQVREGHRPDRHPRQQRRHHPRHDLPEDGEGRLGRGHPHQPRQHVQHDQAGHRRHARAQLGTDRQRQLGQREQGRVRPDQLRGRKGGHPRLHQVAGPRGREEGDHRQHHQPGLHRDEDGDGDSEGNAGRRRSSRRSR